MTPEHLYGTMLLEKGNTRLWRVVCGVSPQTSFDKLFSPNVGKDGPTKSTARRSRWHARRARSHFSPAHHSFASPIHGNKLEPPGVLRAARARSRRDLREWPRVLTRGTIRQQPSPAGTTDGNLGFNLYARCFPRRCDRSRHAYTKRLAYEGVDAAIRTSSRKPHLTAML